jgi:hypothetical protein
MPPLITREEGLRLGELDARAGAELRPQRWMDP